MRGTIFVVLGLMVAFSFGCNWRFLYCQGPTCDTSGRFPQVLSMPETCRQLNGTAKGEYFRSIKGELHHDGFAYAKFYQDAKCTTELYVHRLNDNRCDPNGRPELTVWDQNGQNWHYNMAGYCCACGDSMPYSCSWWDGGNWRRCFSGCK